MFQSRIIITAVFLMAIISSAHSLEVSAGVNAWYVWWSPNFESVFRGGRAAGSYDDRFKMGPSLMAGPALNVMFSRSWSLGLVLLASRDFNAESSFWNSGTFLEYEMSIRRYDGDLTVSYRINPNFSFFSGIKYVRWDGSGTRENPPPASDFELHGRGLGPAAGVSFMMPCADAFFITASLSGLYLKSRFETTFEDSPSNDEVLNTYIHGFNSTAGLGYYINSLRSAVAIGGRYQYMKLEEKPRDRLYGITLTVMYIF